MKNQETTSPAIQFPPTWERCGVSVEDCATLEDVLAKAKLDWGVAKLKIFTEGKKRSTLVTIPGSNAVVRDDTHHPLGIVGWKAKPRNNAKAFAGVSNIPGLKMHAAGCLYGGKRVWLLLKADHPIVAESLEVDRYVVLLETHDGSGKFEGRFLPIESELNVTLGFGSIWNYRVRHTKNEADQVLDIENLKASLDDEFKVYGKILRAMANRMMGEGDVSQFLHAAYNRTGQSKWKGYDALMKAAMNDKPETTMLETFMAVCTAEDSKKYHADPNDRRLNEIWFGLAARIKARAYLIAKTAIEKKPMRMQVEEQPQEAEAPACAA